MHFGFKTNPKITNRMGVQKVIYTQNALLAAGDCSLLDKVKVEIGPINTLQHQRPSITSIVCESRVRLASQYPGRLNPLRAVPAVSCISRVSTTNEYLEKPAADKLPFKIRVCFVLFLFGRQLSLLRLSFQRHCK